MAFTGDDVVEDELRQLYSVEMMLSDAAGRRLTGIITAVSTLSPRPHWLLDQQGRLVGCTDHAAQLAGPDLSALLSAAGQLSTGRGKVHLILPSSTHGIARRHLLTPVGRRSRIYAWLVVAELPSPFGQVDRQLAERVAHHLGVEYDVQHRVARACWNAHSMLARQLIHGSGREDELVSSADYLGVKIDAPRVVIFLTDPSARFGVESAAALSASIARSLNTEVLNTRGSEGSVLLVEAPASCMPSAFAHRVKSAVHATLSKYPDLCLAVGVSAVAEQTGLRRAYHEAREVARCVTRFGGAGSKVVGVDDLGPARLFLAHADQRAVRSYVSEVLGQLIEQLPGTADLLHTMQVYFLAGRSVRSTSRRMGIHENTVRLRMARVRRLTGLDVVADANHQLTAQTALLVLALGGHPALEGCGIGAQGAPITHGYSEKNAV